MRKHHFGVSIESLESRQMLAATYQLQNLLGYNHLGASWKYSSSISLDTSESGKRNSTDSLKVSVGSKTQKYGGTACALVKAASSAINLSSAWYTNSKGTYIAMLNRSAANMAMNLTLTKTLFGPKAISVGRSYQNSGTFSGKIIVKYQGQTYTATFKGTDVATSRLFGQQTVRVPAGKFSAMKGTYSLTLNGSVSVKIDGKTYTGTGYDTETFTFYSAPNVGVVSMTDVQSTSISVAGTNLWAKANATDKLKTYALP